jgi:hypothetical protein
MSLSLYPSGPNPSVWNIQPPEGLGHEALGQVLGAHYQGSEEEQILDK